MVWNSAQTPLYQSVKAHNERDSANSERPEKKRFEPHTKQKCSEKQCSVPRKPAHEQTANPPKPRGIDRDMLLILMVIFILQSEKADNGLILALLLTMIM
ncbi:MAG: hypothetical protein K2N06_04110 [Oscillospiraceae bacterium]|nr:hypothetical protein [Oscillospiraceae bacterium]